MDNWEPNHGYSKGDIVEFLDGVYISTIDNNLHLPLLKIGAIDDNILDTIADSIVADLGITYALDTSKTEWQRI